MNAAETKQLRRLKDPISLKDLMLLSKVTDTVQRAKLVDHLKRSDERNCAAYISELRGVKPSPATDPIDAPHLALLNAWKRAPKDARRRFIRDVGAELKPMVDVMFALLEGAAE